MNAASKKIITIITIALLVVLVSAFVFSYGDRYNSEEEDLGEHTLYVEDSTGKRVGLYGTADRVATLGYGFTKTVIDLGGKDKIIAYDTYSQDAADEYGISGKNIGSAYFSNIDAIITSLVTLAEDGNFNKSTDIIILNDYSGTIAGGGTRDILEANGFKVLCFGAQTYDDVIFVVENIARAIGKESSGALAKMIDAKEAAFETGMEINTEDRVAAMYVNNYSGAIRIYNTGIATSMIELSGGWNIGHNKNISGNYYAAEASTILELNPDVVFLDGNYPMTSEEFRTDVLRTDTIKVIKMDKDWNNYCPSVADGLMVVSEAMLDEYYDAPEEEITFPMTAIEFGTLFMTTLLVLLGFLMMRDDFV